MKLRITFEPRPGHAPVGVELEGEKLKVCPSNGWLMIMDDDRLVVWYPAGVVRSVADVGAFDALVVKPSEDTRRRQAAR